MIYKTNIFLGDEIINKLKVLSTALAKAENIIKTLETENQNLKDVLNNLTSINKENCDAKYEGFCVR